MRYSAAICEQGHTVSAYLRNGEAGDRFCSECGKQSYTACESCKAAIRGSVPGYLGRYDPPKHCWNCGAAYPWTLWKSEQLRRTIDDYAGLEHVASGDAADVRKLVDEVIAGTATEPRIQQMVPLIVSKFGKGGKVILDGLVDAATTLGAKTFVEVMKAHGLL